MLLINAYVHHTQPTRTQDAVSYLLYTVYTTTGKLKGKFTVPNGRRHVFGPLECYSLIPKSFRSVPDMTGGPGCVKQPFRNVPKVPNSSEQSREQMHFIFRSHHAYSREAEGTRHQTDVNFVSQFASKCLITSRVATP